MAKRKYDYHVDRREDDTFGFTVWHMTRKTESGIEIDASQDGFETRIDAISAAFDVVKARGGIMYTVWEA